MGTREDLTFVSGADRCAAWWYPAGGVSRPGPVIVMAHGLSGTRRDRLGAFAERFAAAGFAALVFDHRGFGDSGGEPDLFVPARQLEDWRAAIAYARTRSEVDALRVVTFGSSMGGGNALAAAAEDPAIAAAISQVPFLDIISQAYRGPLTVRLRTLLTAVRGGYLPAVGQPHEPAFINAPDSDHGWRRVVSLGEDSRWRNRVSARWLLGRPFRPARAARDLHCPWLVCVGEQDQVAAPGPAIRAARRAPRAELRLYPGVDHFDIYDGPQHEAVVADQIAFLHRHVGEQDSTPASRDSHSTPTT
ncbi:alpha/beta hydrolase [Nocardia sp. XZ_19_231]|uniref:alpha/beta hydrolase n=1 Tax=Nocardia sp. XZ_19_231 TaxID=2769252 RepID=UPI00188FA753|nr:alpha/beta hydrolase [Nocardia sp. XZ_19_231]